MFYFKKRVNFIQSYFKKVLSLLISTSILCSLVSCSTQIQTKPDTTNSTKENTVIETEKTSQETSLDIITFQAHRDSYSVLGIENKFSINEKNPACVRFWNNFNKMNAKETINLYKNDNSLYGVFCTSDPGYTNYFIGGIVENVDTIPKGYLLKKFPKSDFAVITHNWVKTLEEADKQIGRLVGYAFDGSWKCPNGYKTNNDSVIFMEGYNYDFKNKMYRTEIWMPIKKI